MPFNWLKRRGDPPYKDPKTAGGKTGPQQQHVPAPEAIGPNSDGKIAAGLAEVSGSDTKIYDNSYGPDDWDAFMNPASNPDRSVFARSGYVPNPKPGTADPYQGGGWE